MDDLAHRWIHLILPALAAEHAVVPDPCLHIVRAQVLRQFFAQVLRRKGLAQGADVIALTFHRQQCGTADQLRLDGAVTPFQLAAGQRVFLEHQLHGFEVKVRAQV